jgi:hypothetical protein
LSERPKYSWEVKALDENLGPLEPGYISMFYGVAASSKTTITCYQPTVVIAKKLIEDFGEIPEKAKFILMDSDGGYSEVRHRQIVEANGLDWNEMKSHIVFKYFTKFKEQHSYIVRQLPKMIRDNDWKPVLISLDPAIGIYHQLVTSAPRKLKAVVIQEYTSRLARQLVVMRHLGDKYNAVTLVSSWPPSPVGKALGGEAPEAFAIGGRELGFFIPKVIVELRIPDEESPIRVGIIKKHRDKPAGTTFRFKLTDKGITDA